MTRVRYRASPKSDNPTPVAMPYLDFSGLITRNALNNGFFFRLNIFKVSVKSAQFSENKLSIISVAPRLMRQGHVI